MPAPLNLNPPDQRPDRLPMMGVAEWFVLYANHPGVPMPEDPNTVIDQCIDAHSAVGIDRMVWSCGRSVVEYWSDLSNTTRFLERSDVLGGKSWAFAKTVMDRICPLRRAITTCRQRGMPILGRFCMQRHYNSPGAEGDTSYFCADNPACQEITKIGTRACGSLCYAIDEVQQERIDILCEIQRIGVDALVPDYCRQVPILRYHPALVEPYIKKTGVDPRAIDTGRPDDHMDWFRYRADVLTGFMRRLRQTVRRQESELGRPCPIIPRVPDSAPWLMLAYGLDTEQWLKEDLVDGIMLSPFPLCFEAPEPRSEYHIDLAHRYGKVCIGGIGSKRLVPKGEPLEPHPDFHPKPVYQLADRLHRAGADALSVYQSETLVRLDVLKPILNDLGDRQKVARRLQELPDPETELPVDRAIGMDYHATLRHSLRIETAAKDGKDAL